MAQKDILVAYGIDVDAVAGWLGSYGGEDSPDDISRGLFAGEIGTPRLLKLFDKYHLKTTWFIPGHSLETFPEQMRMVVEAGHEIGAHGYAHENPIAMTPQQEEEVLRTCVGLIERVTGRRPAGYVATRPDTESFARQQACGLSHRYRVGEGHTRDRRSTLRCAPDLWCETRGGASRCGCFACPSGAVLAVRTMTSTVTYRDPAVFKWLELP